MPQSEEKFLLKDHTFNRDTVSELAGYFDLGESWISGVLKGFPERELKERIEWIADRLELELPDEFARMADAIEDALPPPLDPTKSDDDFGHFIIAPLGTLVERHGLETPERALELIEALTQRFSMEFSIRPFLNMHQELTLERMTSWCDHTNYHVRRLVSEGTRARLPWAAKIKLDPMRPLQFLDRLHADSTRYVTRSVANHVGDIAKIDVGVACEALHRWKTAARQRPDELDWMTRHALRTQIKAGEPDAMRAIGVEPGAPVEKASLAIPTTVKINEAPEIAVALTPKNSGTLVIDYEITFASKTGKPRTKVFKLKTLDVIAGQEVTVQKAHRFKGGATTFTLCPGAHRIALMVNGVERATAPFDLVD